MKLYRPILAILAAIALFVFYQWDVERVETSRMADLQGQRVLFQDPLQAVVLEFQSEKGTVRLERDDPTSRWQITTPVEAPANESIVNAYLENLRGAKRQARFPAEDLPQYGLDSPARQVALTTEAGDGRKTQNLLFGSQPAEFGNVYALVEGEEEIFTVSEWLYNQSAKTVRDLRDRSILQENIARATSYTVETPRHQFRLEREGQTSTDWRLVRENAPPIPADRTIVDRLQSTLSQGSFLQVIDDPTTPVAQLGFERPALVFKTNEEEIVSLGSRVPETEQFYAQAAGRLGIVSAGLFADFFRHPLEWGTKRFVWMEQEEIQQIETQSGDNQMTLMKQDDGWILVESPGVEVRKDRLQDFIDGLLSFSAVGLVKPYLSPDAYIDYGIVDQSYRVKVTNADGSNQGFRFGRGDSQRGVIYALREQDSSLWEVDFRAQKRVYKFRSDLEERRMIPNLAERTHRLELETEEGVISLERTASAWELKLPEKSPLVISSPQVQAMLRAFEGLEVRSELYTRDQKTGDLAFRLYEKDSSQPYRTLELIAKEEDTVQFQTQGKIVEVSRRQYEPLEQMIAQLVLLSRQEGPPAAGEFGQRN